jgi:hypothetical protein
VRARTTFFALLMVASVTASARADRPADGVYGRLDGDFVLSAGLGGGYATRGEGTALAELRFRYLDTAGLLVAAETSGLGVSAIVAGDFRPLFLVRFLLNEWSGRAWLDLLLDSIGLELGAAFVALDDSSRGVALAVGFGLDVPLVLPGLLLDGLYVRLGARHVRAGAQDLFGPEPPADQASWLFHAVLTLRGAADLGVAAREPPRFRPDW